MQMVKCKAVHTREKVDRHLRSNSEVRVPEFTPSTHVNASS